MATLILTAVGTAVGGPIGGAIGAIIGQQADQRIFAPKGRQGSRLGELAVQTSSYGVWLPKIFGTMRVAGAVIWSTDLIESRSSSGGGKGRPKTISYSYSASFAVALSARPIRGVRRIWADGKLLRGAAGDFKSATSFRLHPGGEDQEPDPLIASAEGLGQTPAHRGLAYAVFEDFQLEDYGNRIPSLSFEIEADEGDVAIGDIAEALAEGTIVTGPSPALGGYAVTGDSLRAAIEGLAEISTMSVVDDGGVLRLSSVGDGEPVGILASEQRAPPGIVRRAAASIPSEVSYAYYDRERDFQTGLQRATSGDGAARGEPIALPAALRAGDAKALAEHRLAALRAGRASVKLTTGWRGAGLTPGKLATVEGVTGVWGIRRSTVGVTGVELELQRVTGAALPEAANADSGSGRPEPDRVHGPTTLRILDLPIAGSMTGNVVLFAAAAGTESGWRRAALLISFDEGENWRDAGPTAPPAIMGEALTALPSGQSSLFDNAGTVEVELLNDTMWLENASDTGLLNGANLACLGDELIQFGRAQWLGGSIFRLSHLLRGRRGTEWAAGAHDEGESFILLERDTLAPIEVPPSRLGSTIRISAAGIGDDEAVAASMAVRGESLRPPAPAHLSARRLDGDDVEIGWVRRSRLGWSWISEGDTPLGEESEAYALALSSAGRERSLILASPAYLYTAAEQVEDGVEEPIQIAVRQCGTYAASRESHCSLS